MNVLSLFDGMSCGRIALERAGIEVDNYYSSEIDKYAIQVADKNYPQDSDKRLGSVIDLDEEYLRSLDIDLLIGGSPCQGFSMAGKLNGASTKCGKEVTSLEDYLDLKRMGFAFEGQSFLFWEYVRIWRAIKPKCFFLENVRVTKKWLPMFNEAMGVEPIMINSALVSAQNRVRFYWTNIPGLEQPEDRGLVMGDILGSGVSERPCEPREFNQASICHHAATATDIKGNESIKRVYAESGKAPTLTTMQGGHREPKVLITANEHGDTIKNSPSIGQAKRIYSKESKSPSLNCGWKPQVFEHPTYRKLTPVECERLQTVPDNYTEGVSNTQRYKMLGNGWTVDVVAHIFKGLKTS